MSIEKTVNDVTPTNWYTKFTKYGTAASEIFTGVDPDVQVRLVNGDDRMGGGIAYTGFKINPALTSFQFDMEVKWSPTKGTGGDYYQITFGSTSSLSILFHFWTGYNLPNALSGKGIYILNSSGQPVVKSTLPPGPEGAGSDLWFPVTIIYNKSAVNTWTVTSNGTTVLTYTDPNAGTWQQVEGNSGVTVHSHSGGGLQMKAWFRKLVLTYKALFPIIANTALMPQKFYPSADDSTFSGNRAAYTRVLYPRITSAATAANAQSAAEITKRNLVYGRHDASSRMERLKLQAIGQSSMRLKETEDLRFKAPNVNDARDALRRARSHGYAVPPKVVNR